MINAAVPSVQTVPVPVLLCLKGTSGEDTQGHLPSPLPCAKVSIGHLSLTESDEAMQDFHLTPCELAAGLVLQKLQG